MEFVMLSLRCFPHCRCAFHNSAELRETCCVCDLREVMEADHGCSDFAALAATISNIRSL
jgi:hypothetical protein